VLAVGDQQARIGVAEIMKPEHPPKPDARGGDPRGDPPAGHYRPWVSNLGSELALGSVPVAYRDPPPLQAQRQATLKPLTSQSDSRLAPLPAQCSTHSLRSQAGGATPEVEGKDMITNEQR